MESHVPNMCRVSRKLLTHWFNIRNDLELPQQLKKKKKIPIGNWQSFIISVLGSEIDFYCFRFIDDSYYSIVCQKCVVIEGKIYSFLGAIIDYHVCLHNKRNVDHRVTGNICGTYHICQCSSLDDKTSSAM